MAFESNLTDLNFCPAYKMEDMEVINQFNFGLEVVSQTTIAIL